MWQTIVISLLFVGLALALLAVKVIFVKDGKFPNTHVSGSKAMRDRGIHCNETQDWEEQHRTGLYKDTQVTKIKD
jgi:hypothetical protein